MDTDTEKACIDEIDHLVLDADKKVTLAYISNTWNVPSKDGEMILEKWLKDYDGDKEIAKEYLVRGTDANGNSIITIVSGKNLSKVDKICSNYTKTLYSIEIGSRNGRSLNIHEPATNKYMCLKLKSNPRNIKVSKITVPEKSIKKEAEPPKKPSLFGAAQSKPAQSKDVKNEKNSTNDTKIKEEKTSPQKTNAKKPSPKKNQSASKTQQGKFASFFSSKPTTSSTSKPDKPAKETVSKVEEVKIKEEPVEEKTEDVKSAQKRSHSNVSDSNEDSKQTEKNQSKKKMKLEPKSSRSRLMQICDSSSDEEETSKKKDEKMDTDEEVVVKKEKENKTPSPNKTTANNKVNSSSSGKRRVKVKKTVTRTYEDEDGFINTVREVEEVSCSDEEAEQSAPPPKKATPTNNNSTTVTKKKISPPAGKKQGSILNFFGKK